jgi:molecular chaperone DnaK
VTGDGVRLGIDYGTSNTVAVLVSPGREPRTVLFDGSPLLPSGVCVDGTGRLLVGRDAWHTALSTPAAFEPFPKQRIDDGSILLGDREVPVQELIAATLARVGEEAARIAGEPVTATTLTYPAAWGPERRRTLLAAAEPVLPAVTLVPEPVAAANLFAGMPRQEVPVGRCAVVYDFGAGTFDVSVVRRMPAGFAILSSEGRTDCGGLDVDAAIVRRLGETVGQADPATWERLATPASTGDRRASRQLWDNARTAKEVLSRSTSTLLHVPLLDSDVTLGREELDELTAPILARTVEATRAALAAADVAVPDVAAVYLAGGSSRMPGVSTTLHRAFDLTPVLVEQPELVVAEGSVRVAPAAPDDAPPSPPAAAPPIWRRRRVALLSGLVVLLAAAAVTVVPLLGSGRVDADGSASPSATRAPSASVSPTPTATAGSRVDSCVLGRWRMETSTHNNEIDDFERPFVGGAGATQTYAANGSYTLEYRNSVWSATIGGVKWTQRVNGKIRGNAIHKDGIEYTSGVTSSGTNNLYRGRELNSTASLISTVGEDKYDCVGDTLRFFSEDSSAVWKRLK